tara:strand:- start:2 stop:247 length:246 start_codon:yes stop_codon:yes gene_type:complete
MENESIHFEIFDTSPKLPFGPIISPSPGPTFEIDVAAPDIDDKKSRPEIDNKIEIIKNKKRYEKIKIITEFTNESSIFCLL